MSPPAPDPPAPGFILYPTYRLEDERPVVHLWGVLEGGGSFLVRDRRVEPAFFIRAGDATRAAALGAPAAEASVLRTMAGEPAARLRLRQPGDAPPLRDRLEREGVPTFESDLRFAMRYLADRELRGGVAISGPWRPGGRVSRIYDEPALAPAGFAPDLGILSLDIETDPESLRLLSFSLHGAGVAEVALIAGGTGALPPYALEVADERALLDRLAERVRAIDPDILTGWNVVSFDLQVLEERSRALERPLRLGRGDEPLRLRLERGAWGTARAEIEGRLVLDGVDLLRGAFIRVGDHRLDTVARELLGEGKSFVDADRGRGILRLFHDDRARFCAYNLKDAELVSRILEKTGLVRLAVRRSQLTGMPLDRVSASIASLDQLYLPELHRRGFVAPAVRMERDDTAPTAGGAVLTPEPGLHDLVLVFDFKSLYPSLMRTFNMDPLTHVREPRPDEPDEPDGASGLIRAPDGSLFRREPGIVPGLLERLLQVRAEARARGDAIASQATKILMNSFYGVLATPACRFYSSSLANAITHSGQAVLFWTKARVEELGHRVLYGDTDSLFVSSQASDPASALAAGRELALRLNRDIAAHLRRASGVESRLELELDALYLKLFFPHLRHSGEGARKRYAGLAAADGGRSELVFVGLETVRRDATAAAREFQRGLYARLFAGEPLEGYVRDFVAAVRQGERDDSLVYKKSLRKEVEAYTATTPPHVQAARLAGGALRLIEYVITVAGPEPLAGRSGRLDYGHYVEKDLRPIAEAVLPLVGLDWDELVGNPRQLSLF